MSKSQALLWAAIPHGSGISTGTPQQMAPLAAANVNGGEQALLLVANTILNGGGAGFPVTMIGLDDFSDNVAPISNAFVNLLQGTVARLTGYDATGNNWDRIRSIPDNADAQANLTLGLLAEIARLQGFNGATWDRIRALADNADAQAVNTLGALLALARNESFNGTTWDRLRTNAAAVLAGATQPFAQLMAPPGEWAQQNTPAAATQATTSKAAGGAGVRHVARSVTCSVIAVNAQGQLILNLRDGATGAGTILWSAQVALAAGVTQVIPLTGLSIFGTANTAMTLESAAAPAAGNFVSVSLSGYSTV